MIIIERARYERNYWRELFGVLAWPDLAVRYKQTGSELHGQWSNHLHDGGFSV